MPIIVIAKEEKINDEYRLLRNDIVKKIFTNGGETSKKYLARVISELTKISYDYLVENIKFIHPEVSNNKNVINSEADIAIDAGVYYINLEFDHDNYKEREKKNFTYICHLYLRDIHNKDDYKNMKEIWQIEFNAFDVFGMGKFIYQSAMLETTYKIPNKYYSGLKVMNVNLSYLAKIDYNKIKKGNLIEKLLYIFVCNDREKLNKIYGEDELMSEVKKYVFDYDDPFDNVVFYDKEGMDQRAREWFTKRSIMCNMVKKSYELNEMQELTELNERDFYEMLIEIQRDYKDIDLSKYMLDIAKYLVKNGSPYPRTMEITGLSEEEVKKLNDEIFHPKDK